MFVFFFSLYIPFMIPCYLEKLMWPFSSFLYLILKQSFVMDIFPHIRAYLAIFLHYFIFRWDYCMLNYHAKTYDWLFLSWFSISFMLIVLQLIYAPSLLMSLLNHFLTRLNLISDPPLHIEFFCLLPHYLKNI